MTERRGGRTPNPHDVLTRFEAEDLARQGIYETGEPFFDRIFEPGVAGIINIPGQRRLVKETPATAGEYEDLRIVDEEIAYLKLLSAFLLWPDEEESSSNVISLTSERIRRGDYQIEDKI